MRSLTGTLQLWVDDEHRDGPHNMAVDEWLLETATVPTLRVYRWEPHWGSFGYFVSHEEAEALEPGLKWVRRWTGGGMVDHRVDHTYTLVVPGRQWLAGMKGAESYRIIHEALAETLREAGTAASLAGGGAPARGGECFVHAVEFDLCDPSGRKIAGAGQRRSRQGLLHQGSLALPVDEGFWPLLASRFSSSVEAVVHRPDEGGLKRRIDRRYGASSWYSRR